MDTAFDSEASLCSKAPSHSSGGMTPRVSMPFVLALWREVSSSSELFVDKKSFLVLL